MERSGWWSTRDERREERRQRRVDRHTARDAARHGDRASLTVERIADAALGIVDREGLDALTLRRLATELGVGATTIYWYVRDKNELLDLARDRMVSEMAAFPVPEGGRAQVESVARGLRATLLRHAEGAAIWGMRPALGPNTLEVMGRLLRAFASTGMSADEAADASVVVLNYVIGSASWQSAQARPDDPVRAEQMRRVQAYVATLPPDRLVYLRSAAGRVLGGDADARFELGLGALLDAFERRAGRGSA
jgi:AcrR family transcriptional regulator